MLHGEDRYVLDAAFRHVERKSVILSDQEFQKICENCCLVFKLRCFAFTSQLSYELISGLILSNHADVSLEAAIAHVLQWSVRDPELNVRLRKMPLQQRQLFSRLHKSDQHQLQGVQ